MPKAHSCMSFITPILLALCVGLSWAAEPRAWVTLENCEYVDNKNADGDSFHVRSGSDEYSFRLYYADAPEKTMCDDPAYLTYLKQVFGVQ